GVQGKPEGIMAYFGMLSKKTFSGGSKLNFHRFALAMMQCQNNHALRQVDCFSIVIMFRKSPQHE
ncbi:MAG: hypothetical protein FWD88_05875, partial [Treponema sp.]|nr:hypothetical protein [Treponema sp.]